MEDSVKKDVITKHETIVNVVCIKCGYGYSYSLPAGYRGRDKKCPNCNYQCPRK